LSLVDRGLQHFPQALTIGIEALEAILSEVGQEGPGTRITNAPELDRFLDPEGALAAVLAECGALGTRPVRAILFDKSMNQNWALGWHQDRTICVKDRVGVEGFGPFTRKQGLVHVEPPFEIIERMTTLRIHLDDVPMDNAPLLVAEGSHRLGKIPVSEVDAIAASLPTCACLARRTDVWAYSTPILHASKRAGNGGRRRVLQVDYSPDDLPPPLEWLGICSPSEPN
jgi:hypothetical protein